jgi:hypothetical protein
MKSGAAEFEAGLQAVVPAKTDAIFADSVRHIPGEDLAGTAKPAEGGEAPQHPPIVVNVSTPDANSFRASKQQVTADLAHALNQAQRRNG